MLPSAGSGAVDTSDVRGLKSVLVPSQFQRRKSNLREREQARKNLGLKKQFSGSVERGGLRSSFWTS